MSARRNDRDYGSMSAALRFVLAQFAKTLSTAIPAAVSKFDRATRRATIRPSLRQRLTNGDEQPRAAVANVPVLFPGGGGYILTFPLETDDQLLRIACERGITAFKRTFGMSSPDSGAVMSERNAVALPGFGPLGVVPVGEGAVLQSVDGRVFVEVHDERIRIRLGDHDLSLTDDGLVVDLEGGLTVNADTVTLNANVTVNGDLHANGGDFEHDGTDVGSGHKHPGVAAGTALSGPPGP